MKIAHVASLILSPAIAFGWGQPHHAITRAAIEVLPEWQRTLLGDEAKALADSHCMIPDNVYSDKANAKYAAMESKPGEVYLKILHLPTTEQAEYLEVMRYFMDKAVTALRENRLADGARFIGTVCHQIEDYGSPSHTVPGDNMFTLLQQFLPPTELMKDQLMHGPIENGEFTVSIAGYKPALLGITVEEAAWRLMHRVHDEILNARTTTIPIMQARYAGDDAAAEKHQLRAAVFDARVVADAVYTILCLGSQKIEVAEKEALKQQPISTFLPLEAASLYYPQSEFFSSPYWGHPRSGDILVGGKSTPLKLLLEGPGAAKVQELPRGISAGMGRTLTFLLPKGVFTRFTVLAGLQHEAGARGRVEFTVAGDGKPLQTVIISGTDPTMLLECDVTGVSKLALSLASKSLDTKSNFAVWGAPILKKE